MIADFFDLLRHQREEGETATPVNRALFRALAPFRLVEYDHILPQAVRIVEAYVGFPDGGLFAVGEDIPEEAIDRLISASPGPTAPLYLYLIPETPPSPATVAAFVAALADHLEQSLIAIHLDDGGQMTALPYFPENASPTLQEIARARAQAGHGLLEADRHLSKTRILERLATRTAGFTGLAYARVVHAFTPYILEFSSPAERDDFVAWTRLACATLYGTAPTAEAENFNTIFRPAEPCIAPANGVTACHVPLPQAVAGGRPWLPFGDPRAPTLPEGRAAQSEALRLIAEYWRLVVDIIERAKNAELLSRTRRQRTKS